MLRNIKHMKTKCNIMRIFRQPVSNCGCFMITTVNSNRQNFCHQLKYGLNKRSKRNTFLYPFIQNTIHYWSTISLNPQLWNALLLSKLEGSDDTPWYHNKPMSTRLCRIQWSNTKWREKKRYCSLSHLIIICSSIIKVTLKILTESSNSLNLSKGYPQDKFPRFSAKPKHQEPVESRKTAELLVRCCRAL